MRPPSGPELPSAVISGQPSFIIENNLVRAAITERGGMLGPVVFFPDSTDPVLPYALAPWAEEPLPADTPAMLAALRGDFFCSAFGENREQWRDRKLPPHGETANEVWTCLARKEEFGATSIRLGVDLPLQGGRCFSNTLLLEDQSVIYQRHDFLGLTGPVNPGHHATLAFPDQPGNGRLSFSRFIHAQSCAGPLDSLELGTASALSPDRLLENLAKAPCVDGSVTDLTHFPARPGREDIAIICADPTLDLAWSAVTFADQEYIWFALRNPEDFASTLLWFSNGGRSYPPWSSRHVNVMGIEDVTSYFHAGLAASVRQNPLSERGITTCLSPDQNGCLTLPYIQGVARIPRNFGRLAEIKPDYRNRKIQLVPESGSLVTASCDASFLKNPCLPAETNRCDSQ
jgi:hypothetical protein